MFTSPARFLLTLAATFALLITMWVSAAQADTGCRKVGDGVTMCDGVGYQLPSAPRGTVKHRPAYSAAHRAAVLYSRLKGERTGQTVIIARLGARNH
jgi:hypothetical protein